MSSYRPGVLLVNIGTPKAPTISAVREYLNEFLMDPYVIALPYPLRALLVKGLIVPTRPAKVAPAYQKIWTKDGSPLAFYHHQAAKKLQQTLPQFYIEAVMRYGQPSILNGLKRLLEKGITELIVCPLYPQYCTATTESTLQYLKKFLKSPSIPCKVIEPFYQHPKFITAYANQIQSPFDHLLFSFHGLPEQHVRNTSLEHSLCTQTKNCCEKINFSNSRCYRAQCMQTASLIAKHLNLNQNQYSVSFQSRLGIKPWLRPYTDHHLVELAQKNIQNLAVICPSFVTDCLETLEEIGIRANQQWQQITQKPLQLVSCLNDAPLWIETLQELIQNPQHQYSI